MDLSRRDFLKAAGLTAAAASLPGFWPRLAFAKDPHRAAALTTLEQRIVKGTVLREGTLGKYYQLTTASGEPHLPREELGRKSDGKSPKSLVHFAHFTDIHLVDGQSPARVEFLDRFNDPGQGCENMPFSAAYRAQETLTTHTLEAMIRKLRAIEVSPITGEPVAFAICTGDNTDNEQFNELRWFIDLMDGNKTIVPGSGAAGVYEGVMAKEIADPDYWHPDPGVDDKFKSRYGFPDYPGLLEQSVAGFTTTGVGMPWFQVFGNHDGLMQGNAPRNAFFETVATGHVKVQGPPPGLNPCDSFQLLRDNPEALMTGPARTITADPKREIISRAKYIQEMFNTTGTPAGHGFMNPNSLQSYWFNDMPLFRFIGLDTVNPGGFESGSIGAAQLAWLEQRLIEASSRYFDADGNEVRTQNGDRYVVLFSHHGLRSMDNPVATPDPAHPEENDLPRMLADEVAALVHRFPNVIAWVNGHTHNNVVEPRPDPAGRTQGFWDIGTAAHIDWACQSRLIEVVDNRDGTLSIFGTMFDHAGPVVPSGSDPVLKLASISRELAANDYQFNFEGGQGKVEDRNVELIIPAPFDPKDGATSTTTSSSLVSAGSGPLPL